MWERRTAQPATLFATNYVVLETIASCNIEAECRPYGDSTTTYCPFLREDPDGR